jgi:hypothetical protein
MVADSGFSFTGAPTTTGVNSVTADGDDYLLNVDANETAMYAVIHPWGVTDNSVIEPTS